jgi:hypothetical protein
MRRAVRCARCGVRRGPNPPRSRTLSRALVLVPTCPRRTRLALRSAGALRHAARGAGKHARAKRNASRQVSRVLAIKPGRHPCPHCTPPGMGEVTGGKGAATWRRDALPALCSGGDFLPGSAYSSFESMRSSLLRHCVSRALSRRPAHLSYSVRRALSSRHWRWRAALGTVVPCHCVHNLRSHRQIIVLSWSWNMLVL